MLERSKGDRLREFDDVALCSSLKLLGNAPYQRSGLYGRYDVLGKMWCLRLRYWNLLADDDEDCGVPPYWNQVPAPHHIFPRSHTCRFQHLGLRHHIFPSTARLPFVCSFEKQWKPSMHCATSFFPFKFVNHGLMLFSRQFWTMWTYEQYVPDLWFSLLVEGEWGVGIVWVWAQNCKCNKVILEYFMVNFVLKEHMVSKYCF